MSVIAIKYFYQLIHIFLILLIVIYKEREGDDNVEKAKVKFHVS